MEKRDLKALIESGVQVALSADRMALYGNQYIINIRGAGDVVKYLETQRDDVRTFKSLDSVSRFIESLGIKKFNVTM